MTLTAKTPEALILDFGEVLVTAQPPDSVKRLAAIARLPVDDFVSRYWRHRDAYDGGLPVAEYWQRVLEGTAGSTSGQFGELIEADSASWTHYRDEVWDIAASFKARGGRTAMLSNGVPEIIARVRAERPLDGYFDVVVVSCEVGCAKPDPTIYRLCLDRLGVSAAAALFVDDRLINLHAAVQAGLRTLHFTGDESVAALQRAVSGKPLR